MGLVCASVYILLLILFIPFSFSHVFVDRFTNQQKSVHGLAIDEFPHHQVRKCYLDVLFVNLSFTAIGLPLIITFVDDGNDAGIFRRRVRHPLETQVTGPNHCSYTIVDGIFR